MKVQNLKYRGVSFIAFERETWKGDTVLTFSCDNVQLLDGYPTTSFSTLSLDDMADKIDYYMDNRAEQKVRNELNHKASESFYGHR